MSSAAGRRLGPYTVVAPLGAGGMGEVYRATDTRLGRDVAVKVLPAEVAGDPERLARFEREAKLLASLNHPNIAHVYGFESATQPDGSAVHFLAMELVDGEDLAERLERGRIPIDEALSIAKQIAEALEEAHEKGIVHRDLKPANVKVTPDGRVKVLDFGLAKAYTGESATGSSADLSRSPTLAHTGTQAGVILGTAAYMSPEQARGKAVDKRADIWAFGVVLYEMLTGKRAFEGEDVSDTLAAVLRQEIDLQVLPPETPPSVRRLVGRCLDRDLKRRLRDIGEARVLLENPAAPLVSDAAPARAPDAEAPAAVRGPLWRRALPWAIAGALAVALAVSLPRGAGVPSEGAPLRRFSIEIPWNLAPNWGDFDLAISPDGTQLAYNCREGNTVNLCLRALDSLTARPVAEGRDAAYWFFSPDGQWIGIVDAAGLSKVSVRGGQPQPILRRQEMESDAERPVPGAVLGLAWTADGHILFGSGTGIRRVAAAGGAPEPVTQVAADSEVVGHYAPSLLPDGRSALLTITHTGGSHTCGLANLEDGLVRDLEVPGDVCLYVPGGWLAFRQGSTVLAAAFDARNPGRALSPVPVLEDVGTIRGVARDGTLAYIPTRGESTARLVWVDREGRPSFVPGERLDYSHLDVTPDGRRALLNNDQGEIDLIDLERGTRKLLVSSGAFPIWSSDGERATFMGSGGLQWMPADGSAPADILVPHDGFAVPTSWNAATGELAYYDHRAFEIWIRSPDGQRRKFLGGPGRKRSGRFSPDGKWMAFVSDETGDYQVYVTAYPGPGPTVAVSTKGGLSPLWSANGRELYYRLGSKVLAASLSSAAPLGFSVPVELFDGPYTLDLMGHQREGVTRDGRFLMVQNSDDFPIVIVQNWATELARLVPVK